MANEIVSIQFREDGSRVVTRRIENVGRSANRSDRSIRNMTKALKAIGGALFVRQLTRYANQFAQLQNRLRVVTNGTEELAQATNDLFEVSQRTRASFASTAELYSRLALSTKDLNIEQEQLIRFTERVNKAIIVSGASAQEAQAGLIQLSQGLASGALRGDELRSVLEQLPAVADIIAKELGVTRGALRDLGAQGQITADIVLNAFENAGEELEERFSKTVITLPQAFQVFQNQLIKTVGELDKTLGVTELLGRALIGLSSAIDTVIKGLGDFLTLTDEGAASFGDFVVVIFQDLRNVLQLAGEDLSRFGKFVDDLFGGFIGDLFRSFGEVTLLDFVRGVAFAVDRVIGLFNGLGKAIGVTIAGLQINITNGFRNAINNALRFVEGGVNSIIDTINRLSGRDLFEEFDFEIPANVETNFRNLGGDIADAFSEGAAVTFAEDFVTDVAFRAEERAQRRVRDLELAQQAEEELANSVEKGNDLLSKRDIALQDVNRGLDNQAQFLALSNVQREIENNLVKIQEGLRTKGVTLSEEENELFRERLRNLQVLEAQGTLTQEAIGAQEQLNLQLEAYNNLLSEQPNLANAARAALVESAGGLLEGTAAAEEAIITRHEQNLEQIQALRDADVISQETADQAKLQSALAVQEAQVANARTFFSSLASLSNSENKKLAAIGKAAAITTATIDGVIAVQKALASAPPPVNYALAAAVGVAAAANVAQIATARQLGGDLNAGQLSRVGEGTRPELFTGASGEQLFIPPERGRVEPLGQRGAPAGAQMAAPNVNVAPAPVQVVFVKNEDEMRNFMMSDEGQQIMVDNAGKNPEAMNQAISNA